MSVWKSPVGARLPLRTTPRPSGVGLRRCARRRDPPRSAARTQRAIATPSPRPTDPGSVLACRTLHPLSVPTGPKCCSPLWASRTVRLHIRKCGSEVSRRAASSPPGDDGQVGVRRLRQSPGRERARRDIRFASGARMPTRAAQHARVANVGGVAVHVLSDAGGARGRFSLADPFTHEMSRGHRNVSSDAWRLTEWDALGDGPSLVSIVGRLWGGVRHVRRTGDMTRGVGGSACRGHPGP